jgi:hypothetical protein
MLGINGQPADRQAVERMTEIISHRGPDDSGSYFSGPVGFGFRRLSILDLSPAGHQPMSTADGACTIVFNGEIYNYRELREELLGLGACVSLDRRYRGAAARLPRMGRGLPVETERDVGVSDLGRTPGQVVRLARPFCHQAVVQIPCGALLVVRIRDQGCSRLRVVRCGDQLGGCS